MKKIQPYKKSFKNMLPALLLTTTLAYSGAACAAGNAEPLKAVPAQLTEVNVAGTTPMGAAPLDLESFKYTEREFYAEGKANRYRGTQPGVLSTAEVIDGNWPYMSRVLVRAPKPELFNGTLVVEWANVTAGQDVDFAFAESYEYLLGNGYAVAVVSAQKNGVDRLKSWSPERYGRLSVDADNIDPADGSAIDQCIDTLNCVSDPLSWDIMTQITAALKENRGTPQPLPGLKVSRVIALGESQSAVRLTGYYNTIQPLYQLFDGFVFLDLALQQRADLKIPTVSVNSEVTREMFPAVTTSEFTREWDVPGASHASSYAVRYVDDMVRRDNSFPGEQGPMGFSDVVALSNCELPPNFGIVNTRFVLNAAIESVNNWIKTGKPAAPTRAIERDENGKVVRDTEGRAMGGVQLSQFVFPTAIFSTNAPGRGCELSANHRDMTVTELKARYTSHDDYVDSVRTVMGELRKSGYVLQADEEAAIRTAEASEIGH